MVKQSTMKQAFIPKKPNIKLTNSDMAEADVSKPPDNRKDQAQRLGTACILLSISPSLSFV